MADPQRELGARELGRHYVAGTIEADELDERLSRLYDEAGAGARAAALDGLPALEREAVVEPRRKGWWRVRHGESGRAQAHWLPTTERFVDPSSQRVMRVWLDSADGTRHYVAEGGR